MSNQSWIEEFYHTEASVLAENQYTDLDRLEHAKLKWSGMLQDNLVKHNITKPPITLESESCALCCRYLCSHCVVTKKTGDTCVEIYELAVKHNKPELMLDLIERVKKVFKYN